MAGRLTVAAAMLLTTVAASGHALAHSAPVAGNGLVFDRQERSYNPNEGLQPDGCVKLCEFDTNPCDPPAFKKADGRCTPSR